MREVPKGENIVNVENGVQILEVIKALPISARREIIQMINDLRPVAEIIVMSKHKDRMLPAIKFLGDKGFAISVKKYDYKIICFVSKDHNLAQEACDLLEDGGIKDNKRFGELMGFPPGSIESFLNNKDDFLNDEEIENTIGFYNHFVSVSLSRNKLDESVDYLRKTYKVLLEQSPDIFDSGLPVGEDVDEFKRKVREFVYK